MNTPKHYIYHIDFAPPALLARFPFAARYGNLILFVEGVEIVTGIAPAIVVDLASIPLSDTNGQGITYAQFDVMVDSLMSTDTPFTAAEVQIGKVQTNYVYETRFKPAEVIE